MRIIVFGWFLPRELAAHEMDYISEEIRLMSGDFFSEDALTCLVGGK